MHRHRPQHNHLESTLRPEYVKWEYMDFLGVASPSHDLLTLLQAKAMKIIHLKEKHLKQNLTAEDSTTSHFLIRKAQPAPPLKAAFIATTGLLEARLTAAGGFWQTLPVDCRLRTYPFFWLPDFGLRIL